MDRTPLRPRLRAVALLTTTVALVAIAGPASAHVSVSSTDATRGGFGKAVFRVPTESDTASTTKVVITLPKDTPFSFVSAGAKPGWKATITKAPLDKPTEVGDATITEAVSTVTWTASGDGIPPGEFDEFAISGGPMADADQIAFTAEQTYSDGEVVDWDQVQKGSTEPEHPAPTLVLSASPGDGHGAAADDTKAVSTTTGMPTDDNDGSTSTRLSIIALVLAAGALAVASVAALRENRIRA